MYEFLIKRSDGDWFDLHLDHYPDVFIRVGTGDRRIEGSGDFRFERDGIDIEVNYEEPGIHIIIVSSIDLSEAKQWVDGFLVRLTEATEQQGYVVAL